MMKEKELWVIKAAYPNNESGKNYSDYAYAQSLKKYLERIGKSVIVQAYEEWRNDVDADVVIVLRGYRYYSPDWNRKNCIYIMWVLSHPDRITDDEYNSYDLICMGSIKKDFVQKLQQKLYVPMKTLLMCVDAEIFCPGENPYGSKEYEWIFVGNSKSIKRKSVIWSINNNIPLKIWGADWEKIEPDLSQYVVQEHIPNDNLPELYRNAKITVDDHFEDMVKNGFINTRILESLACGLPVISDYSEVMQEMFGDAILYYTDEKSFVEQTQYAIENYDIVKQKVMNISEKIREQYSFLSGAERLAEFVNNIKNEQKINIEFLKSDVINNLSEKTRVIKLGEDFFGYINKIKCEQKDIENEKIIEFQNMYMNMTRVEKCTFEYLPDAMKNYFRYLVQMPVEYELMAGKLKILNEEREEQKSQIQKVYAEKKEINEKLQRTYAEKSEINRKLQITYGEKYDRGLEIKRLKKELESIKKSRSYRLARWIGTPMRMFRKLAKALKNA